MKKGQLDEMLTNLKGINKITGNVKTNYQAKEKLLSPHTIKLGVDLGTYNIVLMALDDKNQPLVYKVATSDLIKDGLVVDYQGVVNIVKELKNQVEEELGFNISHAATAIPPGTQAKDCGTHKYVIEAAGIEVTNMLGEPEAANTFLKVANGAVVDIGGGTTGIAIFKDNKIIYTADEPSGGRHFSLVLAGNKGISLEEAEEYKKDEKNNKEVLMIVTPVIEKVSSIIEKHIAAFDIDQVYLVGGTSSLKGIENIIEQNLGIPVFKPQDPFLITPIGIAIHC